jgi:hypothetical protein
VLGSMERRRRESVVFPLEEHPLMPIIVAGREGGGLVMVGMMSLVVGVWYV